MDIINDIPKIQQHAAYTPSVVQVDTLLGNYNVALYFECLPEHQLSRLMKEFLYQFKDSIRSHMKIDIINTYKYRWIGP